MATSTTSPKEAASSTVAARVSPPISPTCAVSDSGPRELLIAGVATGEAGARGGVRGVGLRGHDRCSPVSRLSQLEYFQAEQPRRRRVPDSLQLRSREQPGALAELRGAPPLERAGAGVDPRRAQGSGPYRSRDVVHAPLQRRRPAPTALQDGDNHLARGLSAGHRRVHATQSPAWWSFRGVAHADVHIVDGFANDLRGYATHDPPLLLLALPEEEKVGPQHPRTTLPLSAHVIYRDFHE